MEHAWRRHARRGLFGSRLAPRPLSPSSFYLVWKAVPVLCRVHTLAPPLVAVVIVHYPSRASHAPLNRLGTQHIATGLVVICNSSFSSCSSMSPAEIRQYTLRLQSHIHKIAQVSRVCKFTKQVNMQAVRECMKNGEAAFEPHRRARELCAT
jgi:hypothetical protein